MSEVTRTYKSPFKGTWHMAGIVTDSALITAVEAVGEAGTLNSYLLGS